MIPIMQTRYGKDVGNCFNACLASLLEIPLEEIDFDLHDYFWQYEVNEHLKKYNVFYLQVKWGTLSPVADNQYVIASGKNRDGVYHAVIAKIWNEDLTIRLEVVHDPNKNNDLDEIGEIESVGFLIPLNNMQLDKFKEVENGYKARK